MRRLHKALTGRTVGATFGALLATVALATGRGAPTLYLSDNFEGYESLEDAVAKGPWHSFDTGGAGSHGLAKLADAAGRMTQAYFMTVVENEDSSNLEFTFPGAVYGDDSTGVDRFFIQWKEKRSEDFDFGAEKTCRVFGRSADENVTLDVILGIGNGNADFARDKSVSDSAYATVFGQGLGNDSDYFQAPLKWDRRKWYTIEWEVQLNTVGRSDGHTKLWMNGVKIGERTGLSLREGRDRYTFHGIRIGGWESGGRPATPSTRFIDDVLISDVRIGFQR